MEWFDILTQGIGLFALVLSLLSFQMKKRSALLAMQMTASLLFSLQLFLLEAWTGAVLDLISFVRTLIFSNNTNKKWAQNPLWLIFFAAVMITTGILTWKDYISLFAILGSLLSTLALWMKNPKHIRIVCLFVGPCWIVYNTIMGAYTGAINEVIAMTSIIIGLVRYDMKKKPVEERLETNPNSSEI